MLRLRSRASSTALVISSTNSGMPSVRSTMSCRMFAGSALVAGNVVDHALAVALRQPIERESASRGPPDPRRLELRTEGDDQQHRQRPNPVDDQIEQLPGSWDRSNARPRRSSAPGWSAARASSCDTSASSVFSLRCCGRQVERGITSVVRQRQQLGEQCDVLREVEVCASSASSLSSFACGGVVAGEPGSAFELGDDRIERAVRVLRRAEIAQAGMRLAARRSRKRRREPRLADTRLAGEQHHLAFAGLRLATSGAAAVRVPRRARPAASSRSRAVPRSGFPPSSRRSTAQARTGSAMPLSVLWPRGPRARTDCRAACACSRR